MKSALIFVAFWGAIVASYVMHPVLGLVVMVGLPLTIHEAARK